MKKYLAFVLVFLSLCTSVLNVYADDGGPNTDFWVTDNKTSCVSFVNPEIAGDTSFFVFDYSAKTGAKLGRPWVIVEKGKCYQVEDGTEDLYKIDIVNGNEKTLFSDYTPYKPTDSIKDIFCKDDSCVKTTLGQQIDYAYIFGEISPTTTYPETIHFTGINANDLFPTTYDFGYPITSYSSWTPEDLRPTMNDPSFIALSDAVTSVAKQLTSTLQSCDTRVRTEEQKKIELIDGNIYAQTETVIWRLANNQDIAVQTFDYTKGPYGSPKGLTPLDPLRAVSLMGCSNAYTSFIKQHPQEFDTIDKLSEKVLAKYPTTLQKTDQDYEPLIQRDSIQRNKILAFIENPSPADALTNPQTQTFTPTTLDEPTPEMKSDMFFNSSNILMKVYVWLPILAFIGLILFLVLRKKK
jgi:hypothetical protein